MINFNNLMKDIRILNDEKGVSAVITVIVIAVLLAFVSLAVDVGYMTATANEIQNIADGSALAATRKLGEIYAQMSYASQSAYVMTSDDRTLIENVVGTVASKNSSAGKTLETVSSSDIHIGKWDWENKTLTETDASPDAVQVTVRRDASANGPVTTFFGKIFNLFGGNHETFTVVKTAAAALSGPAFVEPGELKTPVGLGSGFFKSGDPEAICAEVIQFSGTQVSCAGWHNFFDDANANDMKKKPYELIRGETEAFVSESGETLENGPDWIKKYLAGVKNIPSTGSTTEGAGIGDEINYSGGDVASLLGGAMLKRDPNNPSSGLVPGTFVDENNVVINVNNINQLSPFMVLFDFYRMRDGDGDDDCWTCTLPIYEDGSCGNPNGALKIVGFATVQILMPNGPPLNNITANVYCTMTVVQGRGGGGVYGNLKGDIPNLVL